MAIVLVLLLLLPLMPIVCESGDRDCVKSYRAYCYCRGTKKTKIAPDAAPTPEAVSSLYDYYSCDKQFLKANEGLVKRGRYN